FQNESDIDKYLGLEYDIIVIEEATQLSEIKVTKIRGSLRSSKPGWRPRMYLSTNPGGVGHAWFKRRFVLPWRSKSESDTIFIPANYKDNKFLDEGYIKYLEGLMHKQEMNTVYRKFFPHDPPARIAMAVKGLDAGLDVEIDCIAGC
ncbi:phage terminase large subunit, partial [Desulfosarcina sp.]|uniref:phage terminase large subunit n=1 Tax=Desulfosarcina sp. TaxID=2027861 RepID=UPI003970E678